MIVKLILAQGNPGVDYTNTRHNVGFLSLDFYGSRHDLTFQNKSKFHADIAETTVDGEKILFVKPTTFYNETGQTARLLMDFYKLQSTDVLVIHDDLALPFGTIRTREKGSDAGNNGIRSLNAHIGEHYHRIRIGIWSELAEKAGAVDFVLGKFSADENSKLQASILPKASELINDFINGRHASASHKI